MPLRFLHSLIGRHRTLQTNRLLGMVLAFVAGSVNAGGFLAVQRYTSHMTGLVTDLGIELGRLMYWNRAHQPHDQRFVQADRDKLFIHSMILMLFFAGGVTGALAFKTMGFAATIPLALVLVAMALPPILVDMRQMRLP